MGNNQQLLTTWSIKFVQSLDDPHFGNIDIYKNNEGQYMMSMKRTFIKSKQQNDPRLQQLKQFLYFCQGDTSSLFNQESDECIMTPILHKNVSVENNICLIYEIYDIYTEYFNFTLSDMIKNKKQMDSDELWLVFKWMINMGALLLDKKWQFNDSTSLLEKVFITLKGLPVIYFYHLKKNQNRFLIQSELEPENPIKSQSQESQLLREIAHSMIQLICMAHISKVENLQLYLRKCTKINEHLGAILNQIINHLDKNPNLTISNLQKVIAELQSSNKIIIANSIKLNKFRYAIPKPETVPNQSKQITQHQSKQLKSESQIKLLNGRKNKSNKNIIDKKELQSESSSARKNSQPSEQAISNRKKIIAALESKGVDTLKNDINESRKLDTFSSIKGNSLLSTFKHTLAQNKKKADEQRQKMSERKEMMMKNNDTNIKRENKQNILSNSCYSTANNKKNSGSLRANLNRSNQKNSASQSVRASYRAHK